MSKLKPIESKPKNYNVDKFEKKFTSPFPILDIKFSFVEEEKYESGFTFKNNLLSRRAYEFIREKDECLASMVLDDTIPNNN